MLAVCLPPMEAGLRMGWEESGQCGRRSVSAMGKGEVVREKAMLLPILRRMHMMRCVALVPLHTLECSEKHTGLSECISGALGSAFLLRRKPKSAKAAACRLVINIIGISQQSAETVEAGWAYQRLDGIVEFDQHLITLRLLGSVLLILSPIPQEAGGAGLSLLPLLPTACVRGADGI